MSRVIQVSCTLLLRLKPRSHVMVPLSPGLIVEGLTVPWTILGAVQLCASQLGTAGLNELGKKFVKLIGPKSEVKTHLKSWKLDNFKKVKSVKTSYEPICLADTMSARGEFVPSATLHR